MFVVEYEGVTFLESCKVLKAIEMQSGLHFFVKFSKRFTIENVCIKSGFTVIPCSNSSGLS